MSSIYERQRTLDISPPKSVAVIGVGGVGAWVAFDLALTGAQKVVIVDHDTIENHNLNRTPFCVRHIGKPKVLALAELIAERRPDCQVIPIAKRVENLNDYELQHLRDAVIIDCRDISTKLPSGLKTAITGGYDGFNVTIHINPSPESVWGDGEVTYTITPSWLVPPHIIADLVTMYLCCNDFYKFANKEIIKTFDIRNLLNIIAEMR